MNMNHGPKHLAWHETLEMHELVVYQSSHLVAFKQKLPTVKDAALRGLYTETIKSIEQNLRELLQFYPKAPTMHREADDRADLTGLEAAGLLGFAKTSVRYYAFAITETATPQLRETLQAQLIKGIKLHAKIFNFMYERGYYPSYNLEQLLAADIKNAQAALSL